MSNEMKTIEQIALETAQEMGLIANSVYEAFAKKFLAAYLEQQTPVAWVSGHLRYAFERTERYVPITVEVSLVNMGWKNQIPLYLAPPAIPRVPEELSDRAQILAAEARGNVARKDYESWAAKVIPLLDWMTFANLPPAPKGEVK